ncbi:hypothetical protein HCH_02225 [Hahella chejuensis KCTC 2396]|uniref:DUF6455 domain-containing protein n=1 Tax=Hahella chejuensis (strain KCTC 2396) TaxID=349521 RepID=Q2SJX1_HAHCH|nr:DUF6455 family protein [Hahella chejuensis]ABC29053.1 hypothetical protein HCH_02225 [Hahella chejuensis KCTC 2396]
MMKVTIIWMAVAAVFMLPTMMVLAFIFRNSRTADLYYNGLANRVEQERLGQMLKQQGVDTTHYVRGSSSVEVFKAIQNCRNCSEKAHCGEHLQRENATPGVPDFCPNQDAIIAQAPVSADDSRPEATPPA